MEHYRLQDRKVILTVGRMAAGECYKGHDRILRCLARVRQRVPEVSYLIVGAGDDQSRLAELTAELALGETVIFAGTVSDEDLPDHYALADVFAMPSNGEGFGIVFLEAAACGLHVIGGNRDGSVDPLAEGAIGLLVDPYDENALTAALIDALCGAKHGATESVQRFAFGNFAHHVEKIAKTFAH
jgi:glycosyltransferase involved in cell wall biosynthesis